MARWLHSLSLIVLCSVFHSNIVGSSSSSNGGESTSGQSSSSSTSSSECLSCPNSRSRQRSPQELQRDKLRFEQDKILSKLKLQQPPNVRMTMHDLPSPLLRRLQADTEEFEKTHPKATDSFYVRSHSSDHHHANNNDVGRSRSTDEDEREDPLTAKTKILYIFSHWPERVDPQTSNCRDPDGRPSGCIEFVLNNTELFHRHIVGATLWLYKALGDVQQDGGNQSLAIVEIQRNGDHDDNSAASPHSERWVATIPLSDIADGWMEIDLTDHVGRWNRRRGAAAASGEEADRHRQLRISCVGCSESTPIDRSPIALTHHKLPYLEVKLGKKRQSRSAQARGRRSSNECSPHLYSNCCLKPFYVNFTEIGWSSWILQPPGYFANYCTGSCRMTSTTSYNSIIRNVGNTKESRGETVDQELVPCCAPTKMNALSLLYAFSPGEIMKKTLDNMIVESCGC